MGSNLFQPPRCPAAHPNPLNPQRDPQRCVNVCLLRRGRVWIGLALPEVHTSEDECRACCFRSGAPYWSASCVFNCTSGCHLVPPSNLYIVSPNTSYLFTLYCQYSPLCPTIRCLPLRPPPPNLAFCASASLLFHSLPINLVCLGLWEEVRDGGEEGHGQKGWTVKWKRGGALGMRWRMGMNKGQVNCKKTSQSGALLTMRTFTLAVWF